MKSPDGVFRGRVEFWISSLHWTVSTIELQFRRMVDIDFFRHNYFIKIGIITAGGTIEYFRADAVNCLAILDSAGDSLVSDNGEPFVKEVDQFTLRLPEAVLKEYMVIMVYQIRNGMNYGRRFTT